MGFLGITNVTVLSADALTQDFDAGLARARQKVAAAA
jgi:hypothetical protein